MPFLRFSRSLCGLLWALGMLRLCEQEYDPVAFPLLVSSTLGIFLFDNEIRRSS